MWIDDRVDLFKPDEIPAGYDRYFEFQREYDLQRIAAISPRSAQPIEVEFDLAITDFNLVPRDKPRAQGDVVKEAGLEADAAGFLIGVLAAANRPYRPQAILPYSGDQRQFGVVWQLARYFAPHYIAIAPQTTRSKLTSVSDLDAFGGATEAFRQSLATFLARDACALSPGSEALIDELSNDPQARIAVDQTIELRFANESRAFLVGSLFYDRIERPRRDTHIDAAHVVEYFRPAVEGSAIIRDARSIADEAWKSSQTPLSVNVHMKNLGTGGKNTKAVCAQTYNVPDADAVRAIAVIDLLMRSYVATECVYEALLTIDCTIDDEIAVADIRQTILNLQLAEASDSYFWAGLEEVVATLEMVHHPHSTHQDLLDGFDRFPSLFSWPARFLRAIHPDTTAEPFPGFNPGEVSAKRTDFAKFVGGNCSDGKQVSRILAKSLDVDDFSLTKKLVTGTNALHGRYRAIARRMALSYVPAGLEKPRFIKSSLLDAERGGND